MGGQQPDLSHFYSLTTGYTRPIAFEGEFSHKEDKTPVFLMTSYRPSMVTGSNIWIQPRSKTASGHRLPSRGTSSCTLIMPDTALGPHVMWRNLLTWHYLC